jgi:hypothetical protein
MYALLPPPLSLPEALPNVLNGVSPEAQDALMNSLARAYQAAIIDKMILEVELEAAKARTKKIENDLTCLVCVRPLYQAVTTKCGHTVCQECFQSLTQCPMDRQNLGWDSIPNYWVRNMTEVVFGPKKD